MILKRISYLVKHLNTILNCSYQARYDTWALKQTNKPSSLVVTVNKSCSYPVEVRLIYFLELRLLVRKICMF